MRRFIAAFWRVLTAFKSADSSPHSAQQKGFKGLITGGGEMALELAQKRAPRITLPSRSTVLSFCRSSAPGSAARRHQALDLVLLGASWRLALEHPEER